MTTVPLQPSTLFASASYKTPFGYFDADPAFQNDADSMTEYVRRRFGGATVTTELTDHDIFACFEDATFEFQAYINIYQAKDLLMDMIGAPSASVAHMNLPHHSTRLLQHYASPYARLGGTYALHSASTTLAASQQHQDIRGELVAAGKMNNDDILYIKDVFYAANVQVYRLFNTTSALNYLNREFSFTSYIPEVMFYLLPVWEDVLRTQEFKTSDKVRRSNYAYKINNGILSVYPAPTTSKIVWYTYYVEPISSGSLYSSDHYTSYLSPSGSVSAVSNAPLNILPYGSLNYMSKQFIKRITIALCKELLGRVRGKFTTLPIPGGDVTMDGDSLKSEAQSELDNIRNELKEWLESLTHSQMLEQERAKMEAVVSTYAFEPMLITKG